MSKMENWAGNVIFTPSNIAYPETEEAIQQVILQAANSNKKVRVIGAGHSFTQLCETDHILLSLDKYAGLISVDKTTNQATVKAGTRLKALGHLLFLQGLAMENLGDIDTQSIAGTISTGTHGTGLEFGTISTQVIALKFVNGKGELISCSAQDNIELFKAAQVSLGVLGIITEITLQCIPSYKLLIQNDQEPFDKVFATLKERNSQNRNFEYYWIPYTNTAWTKTTNVVLDDEPDKDSFLNYLNDLILENYSFKMLCEIARIFPSQNKNVSKLVAFNIPRIKKVNYSHKVYATLRIVKFTEMEYNVPAEVYEDVMKDVLKTVNSGKFPIHFPIENRWVKGDDILMSPAHGRDSAYIACHVYHKKDNRAYFKALEEIFRAYGGRPHWGKLNTLTAADVAAIYPKFGTFDAYRKEHDPNGVFRSPYLDKLLG